MAIDDGTNEEVAPAAESGAAEADDEDARAAGDPAFVLAMEEGIAAAESREYAAALAAIRRAVELRPEDAEAHYNLGVLYGMLCMEDLKVEEFFEDHSDEEIVMARAIHHYELAVQFDPEFFHAYNNLATLHAIHGSYKLAVQALDESLRINPDQPDVKEELAELRPAEPSLSP